VARDAFHTTQWSQISRACGADPLAARDALEGLCRSYRFPLYAFLRHSGHSPHDAEDLVQEFFATKIVTGDALRGVQPSEGRFRSWLLACLKNMVKNLQKAEGRLKRGGAFERVSLDFENAESLYGQTAPLASSPDELYDRAWGATLLAIAYRRVEEDYRERGHGERFLALKEFLAGSDARSEEAARQLGVTQAAFRQALTQ
jgi:RNA polymerase sigma-70 factor (ECF subfamily)